MRGQAALQGVYNPDRIKTPLLKEGGGWRPLTYAEAEAILVGKAAAAARKGEGRVGLVTEVVGESLAELLHEWVQRWRSRGPLVFEPFAYESLRTANEVVFGLDGLPSYRMEQADLLVSFGADFLETWLSPVEYARKFKEMHALNGAGKALFLQVGPYQSLTGANADLWVSCRPGTEVGVALGLVRESLRRGRGKDLPESVRAAMERVAAPYTREEVERLCGVAPERFGTLIAHLHRAARPLVLGTGTGATGAQSLQTNLAVNLLNLSLDPELRLFDFDRRHRVETAARRSDVVEFFSAVEAGSLDLLVLNNVNPLFAMPSVRAVREAMEHRDLFVVSFSPFMDETTQAADLILPMRHPLETWDTYNGKSGIVSSLQPAMGSLTGAPHLGDVLLRTAYGTHSPYENVRACLFAWLRLDGKISSEQEWLQVLERGGIFTASPKPGSGYSPSVSADVEAAFSRVPASREAEPTLIAAPSIRFFDGRGANRPWLCEVPDPLTKVAWQTPVLMHPEGLDEYRLKHGEVIRITSRWGDTEAPVYATEAVRPGVLLMSLGQGHTGLGRYARGVGSSPYALLAPEVEPGCGGPFLTAGPVHIEKAGRSLRLARTDGSSFQHGRKIALSVSLAELQHGPSHRGHGLGMWEFPLTLPLPEAYDRETRDFYPPHEHAGYRWAMVVDLDRCIGCGACAAACYAENNLAVVGEQRMIEGREMAWLQVQRYEDSVGQRKFTFLPMLCQHCDNAPCESVCPVYAPHHSKEGMNNQIYNRCIGTRFCSQNCPYKVRRFNWFHWQWPEPLNLQLNPDVTVRSKGVMEKCSFCIQRIKEAHTTAKNEGRAIRDGEVQPACVQTCPTGVFTFGNLLDPGSAVRKKVEDKRAYQVMGYLNTKPAVIYLKNVVHEI
jgi:molybdopterin-containing oxidoreductase family iron-sulfur binding subunit